MYVYCHNNPLRYTDPDGQKPGDHFYTANSAAIDAMVYENPNSIKDNREYGGWVSKCEDGTYVASSYKGQPTGLTNMPDKSAKDVLWWHTHAATDPTLIENGVDGNEIFSPDDVGYSAQENAIGFLITPKGKIQKYNPSTGSEKVIYKNVNNKNTKTAIATMLKKNKK